MITGKSQREHYSDVIMGAMAPQITSLTIVCSTVYSDADQRKYQSSASLAHVRGIHRWPVNSPHKGPVTRKMFPVDAVIMKITLFPLVTICNSERRCNRKLEMHMNLLILYIREFRMWASTQRLILLHKIQSIYKGQHMGYLMYQI